MIEHTIESSRSLPLISCKSGLSKWLEDLSKATSLFKSVQSLENANSLLECSHIYELICPAQSLISDRLLEEISRRNEDNKPEKPQFGKQDNHTKKHGFSEITTINTLLSKEEYKVNIEKSGLHRENGNKSIGHDLKDGISQVETDVKTSINFTEVEYKFPVKSDVREKLLRNIINTYGRKIENNQLGQDLNTLKQVLQSSSPNSIERLKSTEKIRDFYKKAEEMNSSEQNSYSIKEENTPARYFKNFFSEKMSEQFSRRIEGISVSKESLEEKLRGNSGQNSYFSASNFSYNAKGLKSKSNQLSERIRNPFDRNKFDRNQFDKISVSDLKILENNRMSDLLSLTSVNLLIEEAYSNSMKKSDIKEENTKLLLNLIENLNQVMNQTNRDTTPKKQNIFNIQVSGESPIGENDLKNLSDRLVLILKDQARRHGIDLS